MKVAAARAWMMTQFPFPQRGRQQKDVLQRVQPCALFRGSVGKPNFSCFASECPAVTANGGV